MTKQYLQLKVKISYQTNDRNINFIFKKQETITTVSNQIKSFLKGAAFAIISSVLIISPLQSLASALA